MHIGLVREAGGYGDVISVGGASRVLKDTGIASKITVFYPKQFCFIGEHLYGIDEVVSLGDLADISKQRRPRDSGFKRASYLSILNSNVCDKYVDLFCPAFLYESTERRRLRYTRSQLFAMSAGVRSIANAFPIWKTTEEERNEADKFLRKYGLDNCELYGAQFRATCPTRSYPADYSSRLLSMLLEAGKKVVYFEGSRVHFELPDGVIKCTVSFSVFAAIVDRCHFIITADTCLLHLAQALSVPVLVIYGNKDADPYVKWCEGSVFTIEGTSDKCKRACNYNHSKGWDKNKCRPKGCPRMMDNTPEKVFEAIEKATTVQLRDIRECTF